MWVHRGPAMTPIHITEAEGLRLLQFGTAWTQGAMRLDAPDRLALPYAERMFAWLLFHDLDALAGQHLVTLGLGAGTLANFAHNVLGTHTTAVEIDAASSRPAARTSNCRRTTTPCTPEFDTK
jgi:hypothetical protein